MRRLGINTIAFKEALSQGRKQVELIPLIAALGVEVVEIRREFLAESCLEGELSDLAIAANSRDLTLFYSINDEMFQAGRLNQKLDDYLNEAVLLGAKRIKFNFGSLPDKLTETCLVDLKRLTKFPLKINVENNQTREHCHLEDIKHFFDFCQQRALEIGFCFDLANWLWTGTSVTEAINRLAPYTDYIHLKNYRDEAGELVVTNLAAGELPWQSLLTEFKANIDLTLEYNGTKEMLEEDLRLIRDDEK